MKESELLYESWNPITRLGSRKFSLFDILRINFSNSFGEAITDLKGIDGRDHSADFLESMKRRNFMSHYKKGISVIRNRFNGYHIGILGNSSKGKSKDDSIKIIRDLKINDDEPDKILDYLTENNILERYLNPSGEITYRAN